MITDVSALLDRRTRTAVLRDPNRKQAIVALHEAGFSEDDIALALNCSRPIVRTFLFVRFTRRDPSADGSAKNVVAIITSKLISRHGRGLLLYRPPSTEAARARHSEKLGAHLAAEIRRWLCGIEMSDADRRRVVELAGFLLNKSPLTRAGKYFFYVDRVVAEIQGIWMPQSLRSFDQDFRPMVGRWLASWIRFWIWDPDIWDRALDLELAHFGSRLEVA